MERAVQWADRDDATKFHEFETGLWSRLLELGRALVVLFLARQAARKRPKRYEHDGRTYVLSGTRTSDLGTRFGKVSFTRAIGRRLGFWRRAKADLPVDRELGLCGGFSLGTVVTITHLCAQ